jgi:signal transduction histidine kinase
VFLPGQSTKKGDPGSENTGFGLTNARRIVQRDCKGEVELVSTTGVGTTITFVLPICRAPEDEQ